MDRCESTAPLAQFYGVHVATDDPVLSLRRQLAAEITRSLGPGSQHVVAPRYGIPQPRMSELERGIVDRCSIEWLIRRIHRLGGSISIQVVLGDAGGEWQQQRLQAQRSRVATMRRSPSQDPLQLEIARDAAD